eukprot:scaffold4060_cov190-Amphora_coffeaeformis.AAC.21
MQPFETPICVMFLYNGINGPFGIGYGRIQGNGSKIGVRNDVLEGIGTQFGQPCTVTTSWLGFATSKSHYFVSQRPRVFHPTRARPRWDIAKRCGVERSWPNTPYPCRHRPIRVAPPRRYAKRRINVPRGQIYFHRVPSPILACT